MPVLIEQPLYGRISNKLFFHAFSFAKTGVQGLFPDAERLWSHLQQFVSINELQGLLQTEDPWRGQLQSFICRGRAGIGKMFGLTYIQFNVLRLSALADDHAAVDFFTGTDEEGPSVLGRKETIGYGLSCFKGDQRSLLPVLNVSFIRSIAVKGSIQDSGTFSGGQEVSPETDKTP